eukprot:COSAG02_NODE_1406_length_12786_cov_5.493418_1_plen_50_part_00
MSADELKATCVDLLRLYTYRYSVQLYSCPRNSYVGSSAMELHERRALYV